MEVDVNRTIGAVSRKLSSRNVGGASARVILVSRTYTAWPEELWDALTNPERIPLWFLPIRGDLRLGERYQLEGNAGGEILECDPQRSFRITWEMHGHVSWVGVRLSKDDLAGTRLEIEHAAHVPDEMWDQFGPGAVGVGWEQALLGLEQHFAVGAPVDPQEAVRWLSSNEGRDFVQQSSDAWCAASVAAGTDPVAATAAAARTTAAYTGDAPAPAEP
jgi:uncharacterized protein YndB with AHSA1/START domain